MAIQAQLFDGTMLEFPDGTEPSVVESTAKRVTAERQKAAPQTKPEDVGFFEAIPAAAKRGVESMGEMFTGLGLAGKQITGQDEAVRQVMAQAKEQKTEEKPGMTVADFERIVAEKGIAAAAKEAPKYIVEQFLQSAPQMAGPLVAGMAASPFLTPVGGALVGMGTYAVQQFGNFLMRQAQEKNDPQELELTKAALTAAGTAPIGYFADRFTVGLSSVGKNAGKEILTELAKRRAAGEIGAGVVAKEVGRRAGVGAVEGIIAEAPTEVLEQAAERYQAGLSLTDDKAMNEYKEAFFGAAAAGGGIGGTARGVETYGGYRGELQGARAVEPPAANNAFTEATEYEDTGNVAGTGKSGVSLSGEQSGTKSGTEGATSGSMGGTELSTSGTAVREKELDDQLTEVDKKIGELNQKINAGAVYIKDLDAYANPNDERIAYAEEHLKSLYEEVYGLQKAKKELQAERTALVKERPLASQGVLDFNAEPEPQKEKMTVPAKEEGLTLDKGEKLAEMPAPEPIEEPETARLNLVGTPDNPMGAISSFFNSIKPASVIPEQANQYRAGIKNFINDIAEFLGGKSTEQVSRYREEGAPEPMPATGPDVSVALEPGPELDKRMAVVSNFLDSLSLAPKEREEAANTLVKQMPGMSVGDQTAAFQSLLRIPDLNTKRGLDKLRAKFAEAIARYDRARTGQDETALPYSSRDTVRSTDPLVERRINEALKGLEGITKENLTPADKAALTYFKAWPYITAMRSAAFDLGVPFSKDFAGSAYKGQTKETAELFKQWVEENLPQQEFKRFEATVNEYRREVIRANQAVENMKKRKEAGEIGTIYEKMIGRAPSGKVAGIFTEMDKAPRDVKKLDPKDFYPMHPAIVQKIQQGDLQGALTLMAKDPGKHASSKVKFEAKLAQRFLDLKLTPALVVDQQEELALQLLKQYNGERATVLNHFKSYEWGMDLIKRYGLDKRPTDAQSLRAQFNALQEIALGKSEIVREEMAPIIGQFNELLKGYRDAVISVDSPGLYIGSFNKGAGIININSKAFGFSNAIFLHEITHAATKYSLDPKNYNLLDDYQKQAVDNLKELYAYAREQFDKQVVKGLADDKYVVINGQLFPYEQIEYGMRNNDGKIDEFVAEAYSNWIFQDYLKAMKYRGTDTGLWSKFVQGVIKLFKLDNVLGFTIANADAIMRPPPLVENNTAKATVSPAKIREMLANTVPSASGYLDNLQKQFQGKPEWSVAKNGVAQFLENLKDTTRQHYLGAFTLRQLDDMIGHRIPQIGKLIGKAEEMLDFRNQKLEKIRATVKPWMELQSKDPKEADRMHDVMIMATLATEDPDVKPTKDKKLNDAWNALTPEAKQVYREVRQYYKDEYNSYVQMVLDNKKASLLGAGYTDTDIAAHDKINKTPLTGLAAKRADLEKQGLPEGDIREQIATEIRSQLRAKGYTDAEIDVHNELYAIEDLFERNRLEPYFPIRRFGNYSVQFYRGKKKEFYLFESAAARNKFAQEYAKQKNIPADEVRMRNVVKNRVNSSDLEGFQFLAELKKIVHGTKGASTTELRDNLDDAIEQLYYLTLPDKSARKMFIHRTGVPGMSKDMLRGFASSAFHMAYQHSRFKYAREMTNYLDAAREFADKAGGEGKVESDYVNEIEKRYKLIMDPPDVHPAIGVLSNIGFVWYMTSPASAITNMLGIPAVALPVLGARFGNANAAKTLSSYGSKFFKSGIRNAKGELNFFSLDNKAGTLSKLEKEAYDRFVIDGLLDVTLPHDIAGIAEGAASVYKSVGQKAMEYVSTPFHVTERANREIVAMSAYKMAFDQFIAKGYSQQAAQEKAIASAKDLTYKSMFDYSTLNKPRYFQHPALKVILQFKQFSQQMTYLLARSAYEYIGKEYTPEEISDIRYGIKKDHQDNKPNLPPLTDAELDAATYQYIKDLKREARDRLAGTLGMTAVFAGASGLPLWWMVSGIMNVMHAAFGDDDDEWDFDNWFKNWCNNTFGGFVGDSISRGVVSQTLGANVADRLSLNDLWFRDARKSADEVGAVQNFMFNLLGPSAGLMLSAADATKQWNDGHIERAIETASPAFVKNFLKGARFMEEGRATTIRGNELVGDITGKEAITQMIGFSPERLAQRQKANIEMKTAEQNILNKRQALLDAFFMAVDTNDDAMMERVFDKIAKFNASNGLGVPITPKNLRASVKNRMQQRVLADMNGGMAINKKLIGQLSSMGDYGKTD